MVFKAEAQLYVVYLRNFLLQVLYQVTLLVLTRKEVGECIS